MKTLHVVGAAIVRDGRCLVTRRGPTMALAGAWEFPGGKVEAGETPQAALQREILEELGVEIEVGAWLGVGESVVGERRIQLDVYLARWVGGRLELAEHDRAEWCGPAELERLDWAEADLPVLPALAEALIRGP